MNGSGNNEARMWKGVERREFAASLSSSEVESTAGSQSRDDGEVLQDKSDGNKSQRPLLTGGCSSGDTSVISPKHSTTGLPHMAPHAAFVGNINVS